MLEEPLEMLAKFQDQILAPLRIAPMKTLTLKKIQKSTETAKLLDQLGVKMKSKNDDLKHLDRLFLALIDNPRLPKEVLKQYVSIIYADNDKLATKALQCLEQRDQVRKELLTEFLKYSKENVGLHELLRSDRGEFPRCQSKADVKTVLLQEALMSSKMSSSEQVDWICQELKSPEFKSHQDLCKLMAKVQQIKPELLKDVQAKMWETHEN